MTSWSIFNDNPTQLATNAKEELTKIMQYELPKNSIKHFYKYSSAETAAKVIAARSFRWSSPLLFNDPFDHQTGFHFQYSGEALASRLLTASESAIFDGTNFNPAHRTGYGEALRAMRKIRHRLPRKKVMEEMRASSDEVAANFPALCKKLNRDITSFLTHSRVICLSETATNVVMWSHYAEAHCGVAFKLRRLEAIDHRFLIARKVLYTNEPLGYLDIEKYVDNLMGLAAHEVAPLVWEIAFRKNVDWAYEREWRVHISLLDSAAELGTTDYPEPEDLFEAIYLGCRSTPESAENLVHLCRQFLPKTEIYKATKTNELMVLEFERIA